MPSVLSGIAVVGHSVEGEARVMSTRGHAGPFIDLRSALSYCDREGLQVLDREAIEEQVRAEDLIRGKRAPF